jgi:Sulfotransferase domain
MRSKVFGIGLSKTGTSSLQAALEILGYRVSGPNRKPLLKQVRSGNLTGVFAQTVQDDAFCDFPYPLIFRELHLHYGPAAKFVLTTRRSAEVWYESICEHARTSQLFGGQRLTYGFYRPFGRRERYTALYEEHNQAVRTYFRANGATDQLLEVCWDTGDGWAQLCPFLAEPVPDCPFPHRNRNDKTRHPVRRVINGVVEAVYTSVVAKADAISRPW